MLLESANRKNLKNPQSEPPHKIRLMAIPFSPKAPATLLIKDIKISSYYEIQNSLELKYPIHTIHTVLIQDVRG